MDDSREPERRFAGVTVPDPAFADDDGSADPVLAEVLANRADGAASDRDLVHAMLGRRLMVPLVAVLDEVEEPQADGLAREKDSHMASVSLIGADGRAALLAFTSVRSMAAWDPAARGIPASASTVARAAVEDGAAAVLLDLAGPARATITGRALEVLAGGEPWPPPYDDPLVQDAVAQVLSGLEGVSDYEVLQGEGGADLTVLVRADDDDQVAEVAAAVAQALAEDPVVADRCPGGFEVGVMDEGPWDRDEDGF
ncbi:MAG: SseB family protein [Candidatus Nanopelagicales bacterium]